jgi:hypothetical protein
VAKRLLVFKTTYSFWVLHVCGFAVIRQLTKILTSCGCRMIDFNLTQIERFFRACGIAGGEARLLSVLGFVGGPAGCYSRAAKLGNWGVVGAHGRYEQALATLAATPVLNGMIGFYREVGMLASLSARAEPADSVSKGHPA